MTSLIDVLTDESRKTAVIDDCLVLLNEEVDSKSGLSGIAIKTGFKAVQGVKPGFVRTAVEELVPEFAKALDPIYQEGKAAGNVQGHIVSNSSRVADALLAITDRKATKASGVVKGAYDKLRGMAKKNVESAVPRLASLLQKYAG